MKNVYHDYELENDTEQSVEEQNPTPQFKPAEVQRKRRVEYDEHGRVRKDKSFRWAKIAGLFVVILLVNVYAFHTCGSQLGTYF